MNWPLGINPEMDREAALHGLAHWSCLGKGMHDWWMRRDGERQVVDPLNVINALHEFDESYPLDEEFAARTQKIEVLVSVDSEGRWQGYGYGGGDDGDWRQITRKRHEEDLRDDCLSPPARRFWLTATVPLPTIRAA